MHPHQVIQCFLLAPNWPMFSACSLNFPVLSAPVPPYFGIIINIIICSCLWHGHQSSRNVCALQRLLKFCFTTQNYLHSYCVALYIQQLQQQKHFDVEDKQRVYQNFSMVGSTDKTRQNLPARKMYIKHQHPDSIEPQNFQQKFCGCYFQRSRRSISILNVEDNNYSLSQQFKNVVYLHVNVLLWNEVERQKANGLAMLLSDKTFAFVTKQQIPPTAHIELVTKINYATVTLLLRRMITGYVQLHRTTGKLDSVLCCANKCKQN